MHESGMRWDQGEASYGMTHEALDAWDRKISEVEAHAAATGAVGERVAGATLERLREARGRIETLLRSLARSSGTEWERTRAELTDQWEALFRAYRDAWRELGEDPDPGYESRPSEAGSSSGEAGGGA